MSELKPCPFCGGRVGINDRTFGLWIQCTRCGARSETAGTFLTTANKWNTRATDQATAELVEGLGEAADCLYWVISMYGDKFSDANMCKVIRRKAQRVQEIASKHKQQEHNDDNTK